MHKIYAVGILDQGNWELTKTTLDSVLASQQVKQSYDLYVLTISDDEYVKTAIRLACSDVDCKILFLDKTKPSVAWNLFLSLTQDYEYRAIINSGIVIEDASPREQFTPLGMTSGANPGAPRNASIPTGSHRSVTLKRKAEAKNTTKFLEYQKRLYMKS